MRALRSPACQIAGIAVAFLLVAALHWQNDGLPFTDSQHHAVNGLFWWDLLTALPRDPVEFAVRYYARYPVIAPATYPPLFYVVEGAAFAAAGPSPHVAKAIVLLFALMAGVYTMLWARRWIAPLAGWAGAFLAFMPGTIVWSNTVMLNIPATAFGLASLYYFRSWLETARLKPLVLAALFLAAVLLTYYPGAVVVPICAAWAFVHRRDIRLNRRVLWVAAAASIALVPIVLSVISTPVHTARHLPTIEFLTHRATWTFYWAQLPVITSRPALVLGFAGLAAGVLIPRWRTEAIYLTTWIAALIVSLSVLVVRDPRYVLLVEPALVIAAAMGVAAAVRLVSAPHPASQVAALAGSFAVAFWLASGRYVPTVSGAREIATYLQLQAPRDAVLYDGEYVGLFGFYVRALDPNFERRMARADNLLYQHGPTTTWRWIHTSKVASAEDVITILRTRCGCRWVAIEVTDDTSPPPPGRRLLREAVARTEFELVRSFPLPGARRSTRVDLYRLVGTVDPAVTLDLEFPALSNREFRQVVPATR